MEYCAVGGEKLASVQNAKMQEAKSLARCLGAWFGGCVGGCVETLETRCVGACRVLVVLGRWWGLQRFCKIYAKITNFCATIAPIGLGRVI